MLRHSGLRQPVKSLFACPAAGQGLHAASDGMRPWQGLGDAAYLLCMLA
jgi:hypothetical protein